jgi:hypothetical protein
MATTTTKAKTTSTPAPTMSEAEIHSLLWTRLDFLSRHGRPVPSGSRRGALLGYLSDLSSGGCPATLIETCMLAQLEQWGC